MFVLWSSLNSTYLLFKIAINIAVFWMWISLHICKCHLGCMNFYAYFLFACMVALELIEHLRAMGETNALLQRSKVILLKFLLPF